MGLRQTITRGLVACVALHVAATLAHATPGDTTADAVLGQVNFTDGGENQGVATAIRGGLIGNRGLWVDTTGRLWVADTSNNRVLSWPDAAAFETGDEPDIVLGQEDFVSNLDNKGNAAPDETTLSGPRSVAVDADGRVYVADSSNKRILRYDPPIAAVNHPAIQVFGQGNDFTKADQAAAGTANAFNMGNPDGIAVDADGNLYLADRFLHRVFIYLNVAGVVDDQADIVIGQIDFVQAQRNQDDILSTPGANTLNNPIAVHVDADGVLYVADEGNNRVLRFVPPLTDNKNASRVYGQADFSGGAPNDPAISATTINGPVGVSIDPVSGNLYVADAINNRVLEFETPATDSTADRVFGQDGDFTTNTANKGGRSADTLSDMAGVACDAAGNLYVGDRLNNRALRYNIADEDDNNNNNNNNNSNDNDNENSNDNTNDNNDNVNDNNDNGGGEDGLCGLCGGGTATMAPLMLAGFIAMRRVGRASRRRMLRK